MKMKPSLIFILFLLSAGCATPAYKEVFRNNPTFNSKYLSIPGDIVYQAVIKVICSKNFIIEQEDINKRFILAKRSFQRGKRTIILALQAKIASIQDNTCTLYLSALETTERLYVTDHTRFLMFVIPLPGGGGKGVNKIKEGERIIQDKEFYQRLFLEVEKEIELLNYDKGSGLGED